MANVKVLQTDGQTKNYMPLNVFLKRNDIFQLQITIFIQYFQVHGHIFSTLLLL